MADVRISALPQQQTPLTGLELVPIVQNGLTVQTTLALIGALSAGGVTTFSGGATGLLPSSPTVGAITLAGILNATYGGTGIAAYAAGDLLRANSTTTLQRLAIGTDGQVLTVVAGAPAWAAVSTGTVTSVSGTGTVNGLTLTGTVTSSGNLTLGGVLDLSSPPAIGGTAAAAGTFTTLRVDSTISLAGSTGTAGYVLTSQGASAPIWTAVSSGSGNVVGPASATANGIALFDGTTGLLIKNSSSVDALIRGMTLGLGSGSSNGGSNAFGYRALFNTTTGFYNVAIGYQALLSNTTGSFHTAVGSDALSSQTTGTENTAFGYYALQGVNTGSYNTAIGGFAGSEVTTGSNNLFLGVNSGNNLTTGANNVYIGNCFAFSPSESDVIAFGSGAGERFRITDTGAWYINADTGTNGQAFLSRGASLPPAWQSLGTIATQNSNSVSITGGAISGTSITVEDNVFTLQDNVDPTKQAQFQLSGLSTGTTFTYTLPAITGSLATLGGLSQTFTGFTTFGATTNTFGSNAGNSTTNLSSGGTLSGNTKTVNIGTGGLSGSTTNITVGSANGSTTTMLGSTVIGGVAGSQSLQVNNVVSAVNYLQAVGAVTGSSPVVSAEGTDSNVSVIITPKGTGGLSIGTAPTSVILQTNVASGNNEFRQSVAGSTRGQIISSNTLQYFVNVGSGNQLFFLSGATQVAISPTASAVNYLNLTGAATGAAPTISAQGSDTNINAVIAAKGTGSVQLQSSGVTVLNVSSSGAGVGDFINIYPTSGFMNWVLAGIDTNIGYVLTTKGGLGFYFSTGGGQQAAISHTASAVNYLNLTGAATGAAPTISAQGSDANIGLVLNGKGTGVVALGGSTVANSAVQVVPTASSVNYLTFTGGPTGNGGNIAVGGTDTNANLVLKSKGSFNITFQTSNGAKMADFAPSSTGFGVNGLLLTASGTGNAPELSAQGSDANINLKLTPKGTGVLQFGTYTAGVLSPTGFITITDAGGTSRRLLVG